MGIFKKREEEEMDLDLPERETPEKDIENLGESSPQNEQPMRVQFDRTTERRKKL